MLNLLIETAAFTPNGAITAAKNGANRIELCSGFAEGGLSPSIGTVTLVRENIEIPIHVLIRPRIGDFVYDRNELSAIEKEIRFYKDLGINGVVIGVLTADGKIDIKALKHLVEVAYPMSVTFHRAFDQLTDPFGELQKLIDCGVHRVLTSGGKPTVMEGIETIQSLVEKAKNQIIILPGGGISPDNAKQIIETLGVKEVHLSGKVKVKSEMANKSTKVTLCSPSELEDFSWYECDGKKIQAVRTLFDQL